MKTKRIFRSAGWVSLGTLSSRVLGLVREIFMAWTFGVHPLASSFVVAFTVPNLFRRLFGEGALSAAFIPQYVKTREEQGQPAAWQLTRNTASLLFLILGSVTIAGVLICNLLLSRGGLPPTVREVLLFLRILLPYMIWICLAALIMGVLNAQRKFAVPAFIPCILNLCWIAALIAVNRLDGFDTGQKIILMCWVLMLAGVLQFALQLPALRRAGYRAPSSVHPLGPGVRRVLKLMGPAALGAAVVQIQVLTDRILAMWVGGYGPVSLAYSERLIYLPLGIFATALGTVILPEFSTQVQAKDREALTETLSRGLRVLFFIMIPASIGLGVMASPLVELVFQRGAFDQRATLLTSRALLCYAPGLAVFSASKLFVPLFYAHQDTRTPVKIGSISVVLNLLLNLLFLWKLPDGWKHAGLALGTVLASLWQVSMLARISRKRFAPLDWRPILNSWFRQILACVPMTATALWTLRRLADTHVLIQVPLAVAAAALAYGIATRLLRCPEWHDLRHH